MRFVFLLLFVFGCSNLEFVYEKNDGNFLKNSTSLEVIGDQKNILYSQMINLIGNDVNRAYILEAKIKEVISKEVVGSDSATSKYTVSHTINYNLIQVRNKCSLLMKKITTTSSYNSKSAGYNFATDISKLKTLENNIINNIESFLKTVSTLSNSKLCDNAD